MLFGAAGGVEGVFSTPAKRKLVDRTGTGSGEVLGWCPVLAKPLWPCIAPPGWPGGFAVPVSLAGVLISPPSRGNLRHGHPQQLTKDLCSTEALQAHRGD